VEIMRSQEITTEALSKGLWGPTAPRGRRKSSRTEPVLSPTGSDKQSNMDPQLQQILAGRRRRSGAVADVET